MMRFLIIGTGKRCQQHLIPALKNMDAEIFIWGRNIEKTGNIANKNGVSYLKNISNLPENLDGIVLSIPSEFIIPFLVNFLEINKDQNFNQTVLYLDTPIIGALKNIFISKKFSKIFKNIVVLEDWISKPFFDSAQKLKRSLGEIQEIIFLHSGFSYHALSAAKFLCNSQSIKKGYKLKNNFFFKTESGHKIKIINPRNYLDCSTYIFYEDGVFADEQFMSSQSKNRPNITKNIYTFTREFDSSSVNFITSNESKKILCKQLFLSYVDLTINNYENIEKVVSLAQIFREEVNGYNLNLATYDSLCMKVLNKTGLFLDPHFNKISFVSKALSTLANE